MSKVITTKDNYFIDKNGNKFIPKGINMVCKDKSLGYIGPYSPSDFMWLKENGFNLIRLGLIWDGAEPAPGEFSEEYFSKIDKIIEYAAAADIPVFLDMHQDLYGVMFEDGAPLWATITDGCEHIRTELWSESYLMSEAVWHAFDNFWANTPGPDGVGILDHFIGLWKFIANRYKDNEYVVGYDVLNEPFPGSVGGQVAGILMNFMEENKVSDISEIADPVLLMKLIGDIIPVTTEFEVNVLNEFYNKVCTAIREVDSETIFMIESNYFANAGIPSAVSAAVDKTGAPYNHQAYVPHGYDILVDTDEYDEGGTDRVDMIFASLGNKIKALNLPSFIGEWGCYPNASDGQLAQARHLLGIFNDLGIGNVYFDFSHIKGNRILEVL